MNASACRPARLGIPTNTRRSSSSFAGRTTRPGVHPVVRVPDALELRERVDDLRRVHARQQLGAGHPVAVLARERPAVRDGQVRRVLHERAEVGDARLREQVEVDPDVQAPVAEVAVVGAAAAVLAQQRVELPQVGAEPLGRHGGVLPARPRLVTVRAAGDDARPVLPDPPQRPLRHRVADDQRRRPRHRLGDRLGRRLRLGPGGPAGLHVEPAAARGQHPRRGLVRLVRPQRRDQPGVHPLDRQRAAARGSA